MAINSSAGMRCYSKRVYFNCLHGGVHGFVTGVLPTTNQFGSLVGGFNSAVVEICIPYLLIYLFSSSFPVDRFVA
jgi:hypothetical protein